MSVLGIDEVTYGVEDLDTSVRFFSDWGLTKVSEQPDEVIFETLNGCRVVLADINKAGLPPAIEPGSTVREVVWGVESDADLKLYSERIANDPGFIEANGRIGCTDTWQTKGRINKAAPIYDRATPIEVGHVVFFVKDVNACEAFYHERFGFQASDRYPDRGAFLRTAEEGGHHDLFMLQLPAPRAGLNHVAFTVRDVHEVFGGGMHISRRGWATEIGPGRHPVSSAFFWYFKNPAGALVEYYADEDQLTGEWEPRAFEPGPTMFAEWAIAGGIDGNTRRQQNVEAPQGKFLTDKPKP
jgi:catechol 2,3-dioxygenase-like lactoylglutathione lyase family enzyme